MVGMDVDVFHVIAMFYHVDQHIISRFPFGQIIVQTDKVDGVEIADELYGCMEQKEKKELM